ncbi:MAG: HDOD domain-containing protein [Leptospiraceae bacterium]|nr:HDOD domain-containing protein [Leptospiraceae bacterium]
MADSSLVIPPLPQVVMEVMKYDTEASEASASEVEQIIAPDRGICSEILRVANSAYYGRSGRVKVMRDAITLLGLKALKNLIIFISTRQIATNLKSPIFKKYLTEYPVLSALIAQDVAGKWKHPELVEEAFLSGLLYNIGMSILALNKGDHYSFIIEQAEKNGFDLRDLEQSSYGTDHSEAGREAARQWNLPDSLQHSMELTPTKMNGSDQLGKITVVSVALGQAGAGIPLDPKSKAAVQEIYKETGDQADPFQKILSEQQLQRYKSHPYYQMAAAG